MALQSRAAGVADAIAVLLQAGRHLEFIGQDVFAKAMRVVAAGFFFGGRVRDTALSPGRPGTDDENGKETKSVKAWRSSKIVGAEVPRGPSPFSGIGPY